MNNHFQLSPVETPGARMAQQLISQLAVIKPAPDLTGEYNTALSPQDEQKFQQWAASVNRSADTRDYDLRGAWKADAKAAANGHLPDTWKKPNHPTFSRESRYSNDKAPGGEWVEQGQGRWSFKASKVNLDNLGVDGLKSYFSTNEPEAQLIFPTQR